MSPAAAPGPGQGQGGASQRTHFQSSLLLLWASLLPGPIPGQLRCFRGQGAGSLEGGARLVQVLGPTALSSSQSSDLMCPRSPSLGGCPLPTLHSRSSLGLTHAPAAAPSCAPLLWGLSFRDTSFPCSQDGHSDEDAMLIHPLWPWWGRPRVCVTMTWDCRQPVGPQVHFLPRKSVL